MVCPKCRSDIPDDSDFCARCGSPVGMSDHGGPGTLLKRAPSIGIVLAAMIVIIGGLLMFESTQDRGTPVQPTQEDNSASLFSDAISRCDSMAAAQLVLPNTIEFIGEPEAYDLKTTLSVARNIAATDKRGKRVRYRYICTAMADGQGGWTKFDVGLMPANY